jgi:AAA ATPase domain
MGADPKPSEPNPYDWRSENPKHPVRREALLQQALATCLDGDGVFLLLGARGMGKSVFLAHLEAELRNNNTELEILSFSGPPLAAGPVMVVDDILSALLDGLVESAERRGKSRPDDELQRKLRSLASKRLLHRMLEAYLDAFSDKIERIVLLYDELDRYADLSGVGRNYFNALEDARKKLERRLVVVTAGGLGLLSLKTVLGSSVFTRVAARKVLEPFQDGELHALAERFQRRGEALPPTCSRRSACSPEGTWRWRLTGSNACGTSRPLLRVTSWKPSTGSVITTTISARASAERSSASTNPKLRFTCGGASSGTVDACRGQRSFQSGNTRG